jgi:hypothetical protein
MAVFTVTHAQRVDDYAVIQTLEDTDITIWSNDRCCRSRKQF